MDIDPKTNRTEHGDLFNLQFHPLSFDTVICDPPFNYYVTGENRFRWLATVRNIARKRVMVSAGQVNPTNCFHRGWSTRLFAHVKATPFVRFYWVFDRRDGTL